MIDLICPHGHGFWHLAVDIIIGISIVGAVPLMFAKSIIAKIKDLL